MGENRKTPQIRFKGFTDDWEQRKVGELGVVITGSTPATSHDEYYSDDGIPWVTPTDINKNVTVDTPRKLSKEGQKVGRVVPKDTILVTCIASIGKNTMLGTMGSFNQQINGLVPDFNKYNPYFLFSESELWSSKMKKQASAGTMQIVNKTEFSLVETMVPSLPEQLKIGDYFQTLDNLITLHQRKCDKLKMLKKSMIEKMFSKNGEKVPEVRFKGFTDDWEQRKFDDTVLIERGGSPRPIEEYITTAT
ncbi:MAG: restriction endonuclease subunit S, partial [Anaerococcus sp.]